MCAVRESGAVGCFVYTPPCCPPALRFPPGAPSNPLSVSLPDLSLHVRLTARYVSVKFFTHLPSSPAVGTSGLFTSRGQCILQIIVRSWDSCNPQGAVGNRTCGSRLSADTWGCTIQQGLCPTSTPLKTLLHWQTMLQHSTRHWVRTCFCLRDAEYSWHPSINFNFGTRMTSPLLVVSKPITVRPDSQECFVWVIVSSTLHGNNSRWLGSCQVSCQPFQSRPWSLRWLLHLLRTSICLELCVTAINWQILQTPTIPLWVCTLACSGQHRHQVCAWLVQLHSALVLVCNSSIPCCATLLSGLLGWVWSQSRHCATLAHGQGVRISAELVWVRSSASLGPVPWRSSMWLQIGNLQLIICKELRHCVTPVKPLLFKAFCVNSTERVPARLQPHNSFHSRQSTEVRFPMWPAVPATQPVGPSQRVPC